MPSNMGQIQRQLIGSSSIIWNWKGSNSIELNLHLWVNQNRCNGKIMLRPWYDRVHTGYVYPQFRTAIDRSGHVPYAYEDGPTECLHIIYIYDYKRIVCVSECVSECECVRKWGWVAVWRLGNEHWIGKSSWNGKDITNGCDIREDYSFHDKNARMIFPEQTVVGS